jgi:hypothetical protein
MAIRYILWKFGILFTVLVCCTKKNLATLFLTLKERKMAIKNIMIVNKLRYLEPEWQILYIYIHIS